MEGKASMVFERHDLVIDWKWILIIAIIMILWVM
jgi:hypothetical protein